MGVALFAERLVGEALALLTVDLVFLAVTRFLIGDLVDAFFFVFFTGTDLLLAFGVVFAFAALAFGAATLRILTFTALGAGSDNS
mgnify:CR=1 FL=1